VLERISILKETKLNYVKCAESWVKCECVVDMAMSFPVSLSVGYFVIGWFAVSLSRRFVYFRDINTLLY
jgi:hypothetical protein